MRNRFIGAMVTAAAILLTVSAAQAQAQLERPDRILGHPNFNGVWQALNTAYWNLESHSVEGFPKELWQLGAIGTIPRGRASCVEERFLTCAKRSRSATKTARSGPRQKQISHKKAQKAQKAFVILVPFCG